MKESLEEEITELKVNNIKLDSENKAMKMRNEMLEGIVGEARASKQVVDPSELAAFQILEQENKRLK